MISLRIGKTGIPLWFRTFEGNDSPDAFKIDLLKEGVSYVSSLFDPSFKLIFLADRWFNSISLMNHISSLGHSFVFRLRKNFKVLVFDKKEGHYIWKSISNLRKLKNSPVYYDNIYFTEDKFLANIVISSSLKTNDPWILITNIKELLKIILIALVPLKLFLKIKNLMAFILKKLLMLL